MSVVNVEFLVSPVHYEEKHGEDKYEQAKFEVITAQQTTHKVSLPQFESKRGVEGLFYCKDKFDEKADDFQFDADDHFKYFPRILDQTSLRWWKNRITRIPAGTVKDMPLFNTIFGELVTTESNSLNPRDDLIAYLGTDDCKKPRKTDVRTHANRIETLCLYANRLQGVKADLTEAEITLIIFHSFPNAWLNDFRLARGNPASVGRAEILEFFMTKKAVQDANEDQNKKRKKEEKESNNNKNKKSKTGGGDKNMCRLHNFKHPWSECSENPKSKNYYLKPNSPFYRGGGGRGRGGYNSGGRGGRGGESNYGNSHFGGSGGRGSGRGGYGGRSGGNRDQHHNDYRGRDRNDDRGGRSDNYQNDQRGSGGGVPHDQGGNENYHASTTFRPGGWY